jgi:hypothetical protein
MHHVTNVLYKEIHEMKVLFLIIASVLVFATGCGRKSHPSDRAMMQNFFTHRVQFDELLSMFQHDRDLIQVAVNYTVPEDASLVGVNSVRVDQYRRLMKEIGVLGLTKAKGGAQVSFCASASGLSVSGSGKGYDYLTNLPTPVLNRLDGYVPLDNISRGYCQITNNWYLWKD